MHLKTSYKMQPPMSVRIKTGHTLAKDLVCFLPFRERSGTKVNDASGRKRHGTLQTGATWTIGKNGRALAVDGATGHVEVDSHADFSPILTPFSISVNVFMIDATNFPIASKGIIGTNGEWIFTTTSAGKILLTLLDESVVNGYISRVYNTDLAPLENTWLHLVGTYDGGIVSTGIKTYINSVRVDDTDNTGAGTFVKVEALGQPMLIGGHSTNYAEGKIQDFMYYKRVLTQSDINELFTRNYSLFDQRPRAKRSSGRQ